MKRKAEVVSTSLQAGVCYLSSRFFFGGLGLLTYYLYEKKQLEHSDNYLENSQEE